VRNQQSVEIWQVIPLVLAALLLTIGLAMFLSGTQNFTDVVRPVIVVFGGTLAAILITFSTAQLAQALQLALQRGIRGGVAPPQMLRAMLKVCDVSRREGLLGVADVRSDSAQVEEVCALIGDAANEAVIRFALERRQASERIYHQLSNDVFLFAAIYAGLLGTLGTVLLYISSGSDASASAIFLPFVCGLSLVILMSILIARLRSAHIRELLVAEIAYRAASIMLEDNNVQRLHTRLSPMIPASFRA